MDSLRLVMQLSADEVDGLWQERGDNRSVGCGEVYCGKDDWLGRAASVIGTPF